MCKKSVTWSDAEWCVLLDLGGKRPKRPRRDHWFRWEDDLRKFDIFWKDRAQDRYKWKAAAPNLSRKIRDYIITYNLGFHKQCETSAAVGRRRL